MVRTQHEVPLAIVPFLLNYPYHETGQLLSIYQVPGACCMPFKTITK